MLLHCAGPVYYKGYYHLFYQYNPEGAVWGNIVWGHAVSRDLINWLYLDLALVADEWYDVQGVWSGSITIREDGVPIILYTGKSSLINPPNFMQNFSHDRSRYQQILTWSKTFADWNKGQT